MEDLYFKFQGFYPSDFTRSFLNYKMNALKEQAPDGSHIQAIFSRQGDLFKGALTIHSLAGKFYVMASGAKLKEVAKKLEERMRRQLDRWKSQRFQDKNLSRFHSMIQGGEGCQEQPGAKHFII